MESVENTLRARDSEALHQLAAVSSKNSFLVSRQVESEDAKWFAVYTNSRHEKCVAKHFAERGLECYLPLYQKVHHWTKRSTVRLHLPLFPNYVFVHINPQGRGSVLAVPGVLGIVGRGPHPSPLPDGEIDFLRSRLEAGKFEPHPYLVAGERVRIRSGSMAGMEAILLRKKNPVRVVLSLDLIQRSVAVEVDGEDLEPVLGRPLRVSSI